MRNAKFSVLVQRCVLAIFLAISLVGIGTFWQPAAHASTCTSRIIAADRNILPDGSWVDANLIGTYDSSGHFCHQLAARALFFVTIGGSNTIEADLGDCIQSGCSATKTVTGTSGNVQTPYHTADCNIAIAILDGFATAETSETCG
jgi:hypothetical protein